jgi:hypothetical protein
MLVAECRGKIRPEVQDDEDYLTSAIFGHLRYLPPSLFWPDLLLRTKGADSEETSLVSVLTAKAVSIRGYSRLDVEFWHACLPFGEPDMVLRFSGSGLEPLIILVEVKLWSSKGSTEEHDQLENYLLLLDKLAGAGPSALVYLTPRESIEEIEDTLKRMHDDGTYRRRIFRLKWQDILTVAREVSPSVSDVNAMRILADVAEFLHRRGLEYFEGFEPVGIGGAAEIGDGRFYVQEPLTTFRGMTQGVALDWLTVEQGDWTK